MARKKNALRKHYVADFTGYDVDGVATKPTEADYLLLARYVTTVADNTQEQTEEQGDYFGDGNPSTEVTGVTERWTTSGTYDQDDAAQALIVGKKRKLGDDRKVWFKIEHTDGVTAEGVATLTEIRGGSGNATDFEEFNAVITYDRLPEVTPVVGG